MHVRNLLKPNALLSESHLTISPAEIHLVALSPALFEIYSCMCSDVTFHLLRYRSLWAWSFSRDLIHPSLFSVFRLLMLPSSILLCSFYILCFVHKWIIPEISCPLHWIFIQLIFAFLQALFYSSYSFLPFFFSDHNLPEIVWHGFMTESTLEGNESWYTFCYLWKILLCCTIAPAPIYFPF